MESSNRGLLIGSIAPDFSVTNISDENLFSLHDEAKKYKGTLLNFIRGNFWPYWHRYFTRIKKNLEKFNELGIKLVAIASDTPLELKKMSKKYDMVFIADLDTKKIIRAYDAVKVDATFKDLHPLTYLLNSEAEIVWKYIGTKKVRPSNEEIFTAITKFLW